MDLKLLTMYLSNINQPPSRQIDLHFVHMFSITHLSSKRNSILSLSVLCAKLQLEIVLPNAT